MRRLLVGLATAATLGVAVASALALRGHDGSTATGAATSSTPTPTTASTPATAVTLTDADHGRRISVPAGTTIVVTLAAVPVYRWTEPATSNPAAVSRTGGGAEPDGGATGRFVAVAQGAADLTATDNPVCYPQCLPPSRLWEVSVVVTP